MTDRKDLIFAVLATFSVTVALFGILPTRSSSVNPYDPWLDFNDDGVINMRDIGAAANAFGTYGDPTKDVNVTNWPFDNEGNLRVSLSRGTPNQFMSAQKIVVFSTEAQLYNTYRGGLPLFAPYFSTFVFEFNPIGTPFNVTAIYLTGHLCSEYTYSTMLDVRYYVTINNQTEYVLTNAQTVETYLTSVTVPIRNNTLKDSIHQGINTLQVDAWGWSDWGASLRNPRAYYLAIVIEYEYSA